MKLAAAVLVVAGVVALAGEGAPRADAFYLPGVAPRDYSPDERIPLKVNKLTSTKVRVSRGWRILLSLAFGGQARPPPPSPDAPPRMLTRISEKGILS